MKKHSAIVAWIKILLIVYVVICLALYFLQEKLIFFPEQLAPDYTFSYNQPFQERYIKTGETDSLHGLLFKAAGSSKGLVFYLHGNAGSLKSWGSVAEHYTNLNHDVFIIDYPGYGKSTGSIKSKQQLYDVLQVAYDEMKKTYTEQQLVIIGYSIGTGPAAYIAQQNNPKLLILQAPYYTLADLMQHTYRLIPTFILRYNFETSTYLKACKMPVVLFHGNQDEVIYYGSSLKLKDHLKIGDTLITLKGQGHNGMSENPQYLSAMKAILQ